MVIKLNKKTLINELLNYFLKEKENFVTIEIPHTYTEQRKLLRGIINLREPAYIPLEILEKENHLLQLELKDKNITNVKELQGPIIIWQGDITTLKCDAIVNAGNEYLLGCFIPNHNCIDNQIHTFAGISLRIKCNDIMKGKTLNTGEVVLTEGYNLPCKYIIHTVGPQVHGKLTTQNKEDLKKCYLNSLKMAQKNNLRTVAFPCISTGVYSFPSKEAATIAFNTILEYLEKCPDSFDKIVFNVFTKEDKYIYDQLFRNYQIN